MISWWLWTKRNMSFLCCSIYRLLSIPWTTKSYFTFWRACWAVWISVSHVWNISQRPYTVCIHSQCSFLSVTDCFWCPTGISFGAHLFLHVHSSSRCYNTVPQTYVPYIRRWHPAVLYLWYWLLCWCSCLCWSLCSGYKIMDDHQQPEDKWHKDRISHNLLPACICKLDANITIGTSTIPPSASCRNLGVMFDKNACMDDQITAYVGVRIFTCVISEQYGIFWQTQLRHSLYMPWLQQGLTIVIPYFRAFQTINSPSSRESTTLLAG